MSENYTYLGKLKYITHDIDRKKPIHFQWQILDWDIPESVQIRIGLQLQPYINIKSRTKIVMVH